MTIEAARNTRKLLDPKKGKGKRKETIRILKRIMITYYRPRGGQMTIILLTIFATTALNLVVPLMIPLIYDDATTVKTW